MRISGSRRCDRITPPSGPVVRNCTAREQPTDRRWRAGWQLRRRQRRAGARRLAGTTVLAARLRPRGGRGDHRLWNSRAGAARDPRINQRCQYGIATCIAGLRVAGLRVAGDGGDRAADPDADGRPSCALVPSLTSRSHLAPHTSRSSVAHWHQSGNDIGQQIPDRCRAYDASERGAEFPVPPCVKSCPNLRHPCTQPPAALSTRHSIHSPLCNGGWPSRAAFFVLDTRIHVPTSLESRLAAIVAPRLADMGYELVRVMLIGRDRPTVQIMADRADGAQIAITDCEAITHAISAVLDVEDPIPGAWTLEVSFGRHRPPADPGEGLEPLRRSPGARRNRDADRRPQALLRHGAGRGRHRRPHDGSTTAPRSPCRSPRSAAPSWC